jgi:hypothetical protein
VAGAAHPSPAFEDASWERKVFGEVITGEVGH